MDRLESVDLGEIPPLRTRGTWRRSTVATDGDAVYAGCYSGDVTAYTSNLEEIWTAEVGEMAVNTASEGGRLVVGCRGERGTVASVAGDTGELQWRYRTSTDVGEPAKDSLFYLPYVVDVEAVDGRVYAAARRYERVGGEPSFDSVVLCLDDAGDVVWRREVGSSPVSLDVSDGRVTVAFNRCPGGNGEGVVVYDAEDGYTVMSWDAGGDGDRRVGDGASSGKGFYAAAHSDFRGYSVDDVGEARWTVDLGRPMEDAGDTVYCYPTVVEPTGDGAVFATGNTFPTEGRDTDGRHPTENSLTMVDVAGDVDWSHGLDGWISDVEVSGGYVYACSAQRFRDPDPSGHGLHRFDREEGRRESMAHEGVPTAVAVTGSRVYVVEEPVEYHDREGTFGEYRLYSVEVTGSAE